MENTRQRLVRLLDDGDNSGGCSVNFYYYHLLMQVRMYYPGVEQRLLPYSVRTLNCGKLLLKRRKKAGKSRQDVDVDEAASMFWQMFFGTSYELSFFQGLDTRKLSRSLHFLYSLLKA